MRMYDIIMKKRNNGVLSKEEIEFLVEGYDSDTYTFFSRDYLFVHAGVNITSLKFTVELYEY